MKHYTKYRIITFLYFLVLFAIIEMSISIFNVQSFYLRVAIIFPFVLILQRPYDRILNTMAQNKMKNFETTCMIKDLEDYNEFISLRSKRIFGSQRRYRAMYYSYLTSFYLYNSEFEEIDKLIDFLDTNKKYNISKIQVLNTEMLKETIKGNFDKVELLYNELSSSVDYEMGRYASNSNQVILLDQIKIVLGKYVELTKEVNKDTIQNARNWINKKSNLFNAIDNYCIVMILEYHEDSLYIEEFKNNLRRIDGDIPFLKID